MLTVALGASLHPDENQQIYFVRAAVGGTPDFRFQGDANVERGTRMRPIEFVNLSMAEAEELVCQVWRALEDQQIASPKLESRWRGNRLNIALMFGTEADRATVAAELKRGAGSKERSPESMTPA